VDGFYCLEMVGDGVSLANIPVRKLRFEGAQQAVLCKGRSNVKGN